MSDHTTDQYIYIYQWTTPIEQESYFWRLFTFRNSMYLKRPSGSNGLRSLLALILCGMDWLSFFISIYFASGRLAVSELRLTRYRPSKKNTASRSGPTEEEEKMDPDQALLKKTQIWIPNFFLEIVYIFREKNKVQSVPIL